MGSIIAAVTLADGDVALVMLPFWVAGAGIVASLYGFFAVGTKDGASQKQLMMALHKGTIVSSLLVMAFSAVMINFVFQDREYYGWRVLACIGVGLFAGILIGQVRIYNRTSKLRTKKSFVVVLTEPVYLLVHFRSRNTSPVIRIGPRSPSRRPV